MQVVSRSKLPFLRLLGLGDYTIGEVVTIRGKRYRFPSWTDIYNASRGRLSKYEIPIKQT